MSRSPVRMATYDEVKRRIDKYRQLSMDDRVLQRYKEHEHILGRVVAQQVSDDGEFNAHQQRLVDKFLIINDSEKLLKIEEKFRGAIYPCFYIDAWVKWPNSERWFPGYGINPAASCDYFAFVWHSLDWEMLLFERIAFQTAVMWLMKNAEEEHTRFAPWSEEQVKKRRKIVRSIKVPWGVLLKVYERNGGRNAREIGQKVRHIQSLQRAKKRTA